jgi:hypothetical protein
LGTADSGRRSRTAWPWVDANPRVAGFDNAGQIMRGLDRYHGALVAITDANDRKELDAASAETCKAITGLAAVVNPLIGAPVGAACRTATAATAIILDHRRYQVLKQRVGEADDNVVPGFAVYLGELLGRAWIDRNQALESFAAADTNSLPIAARQSRQGGAGTSVARSLSYDASLNRLLDTSGTVNALRKSDREGAVKAYVAAHHALRAAIDNRQAQTAPVLDALFTLGERIEDLQKAFAPTGP